MSDYLSWAWTPWQVTQQERQESSKLILPGDYQWRADPAQSDAALVHFSMLTDGDEVSWLWLFSEMKEALALRALPEFAAGGEVDLIEVTIPNDPKRCYLQHVPGRWLLDLPLADNGISQVWYGFDYRKYIQDRSLRVASKQYSLEEFQQRVKRYQ